MAPRTDSAADAALIDAVAAQQLGAPPPAAAPPAATPPAADPNADNPPTATEKAVAAVSPQTEGDQSREEAFIEIDLGDGNKELLSQSQVLGLKSRYRDLNYKHMNMKPLEPAISLLQSIMDGASRDGKQLSGEELAEFLASAVQGFASKPTMGTTEKPSSEPGRNDTDIDSELSAWERENAVTLPPMYKNMASSLTQLRADNDELKQMLTAFLNEARGVTTDAAQLAQRSGEQEQGAYQQTIANNLNRAQSAAKLPDDAADDFFNFAFARGYTLEDFIDGDLTNQVMNDFVAVRSTPEMERLRQLNQRRQAFTGAADPTPGAGGPAPAPDVNQQFIDSVAAQAKQRRGLA